jgi:uncharacterized damage-inducible protein DinB
MEFIAQDISTQRAVLLARLAAERSHLLLKLEGLHEDALTSEPISGEWTAAVLLAHLAYWEAFAADRLGKLADGRLEEIRPLSDGDTLEARNANMVTQFAGLSFDEAVAMLQKERRGFLLALGQYSDEALERQKRLRPGWRIRPRTWAAWPHRHDAEHATAIERWRNGRASLDPSRRVIHRALLRPLLGLAQQEFLTLAALLPADERESRTLEGEWTLKQIIGHLVDYERLGVVALKAVAAERDPVYDDDLADFDVFNNSRAPTWASMSWNEVWAHYRATRRALLLIVETLPDDALARPFAAPWPEMTTPCGYLLDMAQHQREHADALRKAFTLPPLPRRLGHGG